VRLSYVWHGLPGHPILPPLTDATIGIYTFATIAAFIDVVGITQGSGAYGWWIALIVGLITTVFTALTGFADWLRLEWAARSRRRPRGTCSRWLAQPSSSRSRRSSATRATSTETSAAARSRSR
jgi:uncharacterized membrane protein